MITRRTAIERPEWLFTGHLLPQHLHAGSTGAMPSTMRREIALKHAKTHKEHHKQEQVCPHSLAIDEHWSYQIIVQAKHKEQHTERHPLARKHKPIEGAVGHSLIDKLRKHGGYVEYEPKRSIKQVLGFLLSFHDERNVTFRALKLGFSFHSAKCHHQAMAYFWANSTHSRVAYAEKSGRFVECFWILQVKPLFLQMT